MALCAMRFYTLSLCELLGECKRDTFRLIGHFLQMPHADDEHARQEEAVTRALASLLLDNDLLNIAGTLHACFSLSVLFKILQISTAPLTPVSSSARQLFLFLGNIFNHLQKTTSEGEKKRRRNFMHLAAPTSMTVIQKRYLVVA